MSWGPPCGRCGYTRDDCTCPGFIEKAVAAAPKAAQQAQGVPDYHVWAIGSDGYPFKLRGSVPIPAGTELVAKTQAGKGEGSSS